MLHGQRSLADYDHINYITDPEDGSPPASPVLDVSRQEHWSRLPFPSPRAVPDPGVEPMSPALQADSLPLSHLESTVRLKKQNQLRPQVRTDALTSQGDLDDLDTLKRAMSQNKMSGLNKM